MQTNGNSPVARTAGVLVRVVVPFSDDGNPDKEQFLRHRQASWKTVRAPLTSLSSTNGDSRYKELQEAGYDCANKQP